MSCKSEGSTHCACDCVLEQLRLADELAKRARDLATDRPDGCSCRSACEFHGYANDEVLCALAAYEKAKEGK